jgi:hypothetical protein
VPSSQVASGTVVAIPTEVTSIVPCLGVFSGLPPVDVESVLHKEGNRGRGGTKENGVVSLLDRATPLIWLLWSELLRDLVFTVGAW